MAALMIRSWGPERGKLAITGGDYSDHCGGQCVIRVGYNGWCPSYDARGRTGRAQRDDAPAAGRSRS